MNTCCLGDPAGDPPAPRHRPRRERGGNPTRTGARRPGERVAQMRRAVSRVREGSGPRALLRRPGFEIWNRGEVGPSLPAGPALRGRAPPGAARRGRVRAGGRQSGEPPRARGRRDRGHHRQGHEVRRGRLGGASQRAGARPGAGSRPERLRPCPWRLPPETRNPAGRGACRIGARWRRVAPSVGAFLGSSTPTTKLGRDNGTAPARQFYLNPPCPGSVRLASVCPCVRSILPPPGDRRP